MLVNILHSHGFQLILIADMALSHLLIGGSHPNDFKLMRCCVVIGQLMVLPIVYENGDVVIG